jgi:membrane protease YdiL (CAAX protease family)
MNLDRLVVGLAIAPICIALTFLGPRQRFWDRMTLMGLTLGGFGLVSERAARRLRPRPADVAVGLASAAAQYGIFRVGDRIARRVMPHGAEDIADIYALRALRQPIELAVRLSAVISPAEEIFWRGFVQSRLMRRFGRWPGAATAAAAYGGVHLATGNPTLAGAATVAGIHWTILFAAGASLPALMVSHAAWDLWIFLLQPTTRLPAAPA